MSVVTRYITHPLSNKEIRELSQTFKNKKFILNELRELQKLMRDEKHPNRKDLLIQFNNLLKLYTYLKDPVDFVTSAKAQKQAVRDVYETITKQSGENGPADVILKYLGHGRKTRKNKSRKLK